MPANLVPAGAFAEDARAQDDDRALADWDFARAVGPAKVSVIVINYNYGRFIERAVESVFEQTYPHVECIVVDNRSTDDSPAVIARLAERYPSLRVIERAGNDGQTAAMLDGLAMSDGAYVVLLDADDILLPHAIETHVRVHLSSRVHVGFTCGDMLQMVDGQVVLTTGEAMAEHLRKSSKASLLREGELPPRSAPSQHDLAARVHLVPKSQQGWIWSPTSGLCFRRDALDLVCEDRIRTLRTQTDLYLVLGVNGLCGSILIDAPLFAYRIHGSNVFSKGAQIVGKLAYDLTRSTGDLNLAHCLLIERVLGNIRLFIQHGGQAPAVLHLLLRLRHKARYPDGRACLPDQIRRNFGDLRATLGLPGALAFALAARTLPVSLGRRPGAT